MSCDKFREEALVRILVRCYKRTLPNIVAEGYFSTWYHGVQIWLPNDSNSWVALPSPSPITRDALHVGRTFCGSFCKARAIAWLLVTCLEKSATSSLPLKVLLKSNGVELLSRAALTSSRL